MNIYPVSQWRDFISFDNFYKVLKKKKKEYYTNGVFSFVLGESISKRITVMDSDMDKCRYDVSTYTGGDE